MRTSKSEKWTIIKTKKSLLGMPSKRKGVTPPSVTSQPPRLTALIFKLETEQIGKRTTMLSSNILELIAICT